MFHSIVAPTIRPQQDKLRVGLALGVDSHGHIYSRVRWRGVGKFGPPFFLAHMENGPTEIVSVMGTFYEIILVRFRHRAWVTFGQYIERMNTAVREKLCWNRNIDDFWPAEK